MLNRSVSNGAPLEQPSGQYHFDVLCTQDNASEAVKQQAAGAVKFQDEAQGSQSRVEMHQYVMEKSPNLRAHGGVSAAPAEDQTQQKARDSVFTAPGLCLLCFASDTRLAPGIVSVSGALQPNGVHHVSASQCFISYRVASVLQWRH